MKSLFKMYVGIALNALGFPAIIRECEYGGELGNKVRVRKSPLFTIITVNGVDVYFSRITGTIDGTGMMANEHFKKAENQPPTPQTCESEDA